MMEINQIKMQIYQLESDLLTGEVRESAAKTEARLSEDFIEFTSSGTVYHYTKGDVFINEKNNPELRWDILEFDIIKLSEDCFLAMYKLIKKDEKDENRKCSLRSSIWKNKNGQLKMIFHQGTPIPAEKYDIENVMEKLL